MNKNKFERGSVHIILTLVLALAVMGTLGFVVWQNYSKSKNDTSKNNSNTITNDSEDKDVSMKMFSIPELELNLSYPNEYSLTKNTEENRAGSSVSYDFEKYNYSDTELGEIMIFTKQSISDYAITCLESGPMGCFEGYFPTLQIYNSLSAAFKDSKSIIISDDLEYIFKNINGRNWLITNHDYSMRKAGAQREYTTFVADKMVSIYINMTNLSKSDASDLIFKNISFK